MFTFKVISARRLSVALATAAAALLVGCAGSQGQLNPQPVVPGASSAHSPIAATGKAHCTGHGGVRLAPCAVDFTTSNPGPDTVTTLPPKFRRHVGGTFSESDDCGGASGIATVTKGSGDVWTVTAGATSGSCTARFDLKSKYHKLIGYVNLAITNSL